MDEYVNITVDYNNVKGSNAEGRDNNKENAYFVFVGTSPSTADTLIGQGTPMTTKL